MCDQNVSFVQSFHYISSARRNTSIEIMLATPFSGVIFTLIHTRTLCKACSPELPLAIFGVYTKNKLASVEQKICISESVLTPS